MVPNPRTRKKVLFVDDDLSFLDLFCQVMELASKGDWQIHSAATAGRAIFLMQEHQFNLVVIDARMPVVDGLQLLRLVKGKFPQIPKAILTGAPNAADRTACLATGADLYLEKPTSSDGMETIFATLNTLAINEVEEGFRGEVRRVGLQDVLQMECLGQKSSIVEVQTADVVGEIFINNGALIRAQFKTAAGTQALYHMLSLKGGSFRIKPFCAPSEVSISNSWESLLMEAAQMRDETSMIVQSQSGTRTTVRKAPSPAKLPENTVFARHIQEMLVCGPEGQVVHQSDCTDVEGRLRFLEFVRSQANRLSEALPLGRLNWVEMQMPFTRAVAQFPADAAVFVETRKVVKNRAAKV